MEDKIQREMWAFVSDVLDGCEPAYLGWAAILLTIRKSPCPQCRTARSRPPRKIVG